MGRGADLGNVERRHIGTEANGGAAEDSPDDEGGKRPGPASQYGGDSEEYGGGEENAASPIAVCEGSCGERTKQASDESATVGPANESGGREVKVDFVELPGASDDDPVVAEEQTAQGSHQGNAPDVEAALRRHQGGLRRYR